eukprot:8995488-Alexandrium_andersonii.AAC.1
MLLAWCKPDLLSGRTEALDRWVGNGVPLFVGSVWLVGSAPLGPCGRSPRGDLVPTGGAPRGDLGSE